MGKREIKEIFSYVRYSDEADPQEYSIVYRDMDTLCEVSFPEFEELLEDSFIPEHRIVEIKEKGKAIFHREE
jgi:uncharacterized protein (UPF0248 family)